MKSFIHYKLVNRLKAKAYDLDLVNSCALVRWKDFLFVCHHQRITTQEAHVLLGELCSLGLALKVSKKDIKIFF